MMSTSMPPKVVRFAEEAVVGMMVDEALDRDQIATWEAWRNNSGGRSMREGKILLSEPVDALFRAALGRQARLLAASTDPDDGNDLAMIRDHIGA